LQPKSTPGCVDGFDPQPCSCDSPDVRRQLRLQKIEIRICSPKMTTRLRGNKNPIALSASSVETTTSFVFFAGSVWTAIDCAEKPHPPARRKKTSDIFVWRHNLASNGRLNFKRAFETLSHRSQVQMSISKTILDMMQALLRKLIPQVIISTLATVLVSTILSPVTNTAPSVTPDSARSLARNGEATYNYGELAALDAREPVAEFLERVALTHVAALKEPAASARQTPGSAAEEPKSTTAPLPPPRRSATPRQEPGSSKPYLAQNAAKTLPLQPPLPPTVPAPKVPAVAAEPAEEKPLLPLQYGMRLVANLQNIVSASNSFVVAIATSMGDGLTSVAKKL
jgi:hypothetical protein